MAKEDLELTIEGKEKLEAELDELKNVRRPANVEALKEARALGDLSENAEYDAARNEQAVIETRIKELETILENATIISADKITGEEVSIGTVVTLEFIEDDETEVYTLVGTKEADVFNNKISTKSPIAMAIMGKKVGTVATVKCDAGDYDVKVVDIKIAQ
ncbi:MAG: transcription elongation factor GreA [Bacilli bacterium]|jgi:transcription elongation factor GreA|nr:transcription elongation factor GreA [Bacilli bacterium]